MRKFIIKNYKNIGVEKEVSLNLPTDGGLCVILEDNKAAFREAFKKKYPNIKF